MEVSDQSTSNLLQSSKTGSLQEAQRKNIFDKDHEQAYSESVHWRRQIVQHIAEGSLDGCHLKVVSDVYGHSRISSEFHGEFPLEIETGAKTADMLSKPSQTVNKRVV